MLVNKKKIRATERFPIMMMIIDGLIYLKDTFSRAAKKRQRKATRELERINENNKYKYESSRIRSAKKNPYSGVSKERKVTHYSGMLSQAVSTSKKSPRARKDPKTRPRTRAYGADI